MANELKKGIDRLYDPVFVISGCGKTTKEEANNTTNQETLAQVSGQGTGQDTEKTESSGTEASGDDESQDAEVSRDLFAMDTYMTLTAYGEHAQEAVDKAAESVEALDALLSTGDENSEIYQLNQKEEATLSEDGGYLVERALELYKKTDGAFDIAIYPVMQAWGFPTQEYHVPDKDTLKEKLTLADASKVNYDKDTRKISFDRDGMEIDLGGIAKGYTSAQIMQIYQDCGVTSGLVNSVETYRLWDVKQTAVNGE